ncbi:hypothetical protein F5148DRAFT_1146285 [Russula earlei]|uniref:Uncharacterized protein n=1 Tax=Russula earlei TaxID=71964 RepID=A0ACC0UKX8_9AGAM|nr:hypothetical protein F5148DRAFT_1146285 [Russula earlei]
MTTQENNNVDPSLDYVDDSEPERKRIRLQATETKRRRTFQKQLQRQNIALAHSPPLSHAPTYHHSADGHTICVEGLEEVVAEVTQSHVENAAIGVIDISTQSCSQLPTQSPSPLLPDSSGQRASPAPASQHSPCIDTTVIQEEPTPPIGIKSHVDRGKFEKLGQESLTGRSVTKPDVGPLLKCVSCEARWTIQKGAARKSSHMTMCARKNGISESTLQRLIEKELLKIRHAKTDDKLTTPDSDPAHVVAQTYMESVVEEAQQRQRRKQRRTDSAGTLQPVSQTRAAILDRAKALLGTREPTVSCDAFELERTQTFGRSKLGMGHKQEENVDPTVPQLSEECALSSRLAFLRSMARSPTTDLT